MTTNIHRRPSQRDRILAVLRHRPNGVNETAFAAPAVIDGGLPIQRVAARIFELRSEGYDIRSHRESNGTATYRLIEAQQMNHEQRNAA